MKKERLDVLLVQRGLSPSRERAKADIMSGLVFVAGQRVDKAGAPVAEDAVIELRGAAPAFVSRGGLKLEKALDTFGMDPAGKICLEIPQYLSWFRAGCYVLMILLFTADLAAFL